MGGGASRPGFLAGPDLFRDPDGRDCAGQARHCRVLTPLAYTILRSRRLAVLRCVLSRRRSLASFASGAPEPEKDQGASSFSSTGVTGTTWRLNFSSDSSSPAATPINCERWRIGIW
jgi:hypothetical protein